MRAHIYAAVGEARLPMTFDISMAVRRTDKELKAQVGRRIVVTRPANQCDPGLLWCSRRLGTADRSVSCAGCFRERGRNSLLESVSIQSAPATKGDEDGAA